MIKDSKNVYGNPRLQRPNFTLKFLKVCRTILDLEICLDCYRERVVGRRDEDDRGGGRGQNWAQRLQIGQRVAFLTLQVDDGLDRGALVGDARPETNDAYREKKLTLIHERDPMSDKAIGILIL